jgi:hypothetical protein
MAKKNFHTNIMLDLECAGIEIPNPAIIEIGALYFDIDTGKELDYFSTPVSLESSIKHGLVTDDETENWLQRNIPRALQTSKTTSVTLPMALRNLSSFIETCSRAMKHELEEHSRFEDSQVMIWGNGATSDNVWIESAYRACKIEKPWLYYNNMCVRTFVKQCAFMTGHDYSREVQRRGPKHIALENCKHQVLYLVKARNHLMPGGRAKGLRALVGSRIRPANGERLPRNFSTSAIEQKTPESEIARVNTMTSQPTVPAKRQLPTPEVSFSGNGAGIDEGKPPTRRVYQGPGPDDQDLFDHDLSDQDLLEQGAEEL